MLWKLQPKGPANPNKRGPRCRDQSGPLGISCKISCKRYLGPARGTAAGSPRTPGQGGRTWGETPQARCAETQPPSPGRAPTHPPLLVLLPVHDDHVALGERQLVRVVGHAVVQRLDPLRLQPSLREGRRGQRLAWPGGEAHGQRTGPRGPDHRGGEFWEGPEKEGKISQPWRAGNMAAGVWCAQGVSPGAVERAKPTCWKLWCRILPDRSWVQQEAIPLPNQGKREDLLPLSPWGIGRRELIWPEQRGRTRRVHPLTVCDFLGMGAGGCTAAVLDRGPRASVPERSTALGPK